MRPLSSHTRAPSRLSSGIHPLALAVSAAVAVSLAPAARAQCPLNFGPATNLTTSTNPWSVAIADFNRDGNPDMVVANRGSDTLSVLLGTGTGSFSLPLSLRVSSTPVSVAVGDFNDDGKLDLVVANSGFLNNISVIIGNGDGTFAAAVNYPVGTTPSDVAIGDFNGDGRSDLAVTNSGSNTVSILLGTGAGTFFAPTNFPVGNTPNSVAVGDFNGDGKPDLAVANYAGNTISVLPGTGIGGAGAFAARTDFAVGANPNSVAVGDFDGDGKPDLAVANAFNGAAGNSVSILFGTGLAGPSAFGSRADFAVGNSPFSVAVGDLNADGKPDLAVTNSFNGAGGNNVSILLGTGISGAGSFIATPTFAVGAGPYSAAFGDFNADGKLDMAVANVFSHNVSVLLNTSLGFAEPVLTQQPLGQVVQSGSSAVFTAAANGFGNTLIYEWRRNGTPLVNGGNISGATSATLTINPALAGDMALYGVTITSASACGAAAQVVTSVSVALAVTPSPQGISNDNCASAQRIGDNIPLNFSTIGATTDGPSEANLSFCCGDPQINSDVWFVFQATHTGTAVASLCGSNYDTKVAIYTGTACPVAPDTALAGNDDSCGLQSRVAFPCTAGNQYLIRVGGYLTNTGAAQLVVTSTPAETCFSDLAGGGDDGLAPDGTVDGNDFIAFINAFAAGC